MSSAVAGGWQGVGRKDEDGVAEKRQRRLVTQGRTFVDRLCLRALSCDNVATMARQCRHYDGYQAARRMAALSLSFSLPVSLGAVRFPLQERAGRTPGEKMGVTMDL